MSTPPALSPPIDAIVLISFGGPERREDVLPFLENVVRGRRVPEERLLEVAEHYDLFDGVSPINGENRALLAALLAELNAHGRTIPVYWGNRNWHPLLEDTVAEMAADGVRHALALVTSAFGSYSGCRQYLEDIDRAVEAAGPSAPRIDKLRLFYNHPGFIEAMADRVRQGLETLPAERRGEAVVVFTAHSVPIAMADAGPYVAQLHEACRLTAEQAGCGPWQLAYQSRSGPPQQAWIEPDVGDWLLERHRQSPVESLIVVPIGFLCDHIEVVYDLDVELAALCDELGINMVRCGTVGRHPRFVAMVRELIEERLDPSRPRQVIGRFPAWPDQCPPGCCRK